MRKKMTLALYVILGLVALVFGIGILLPKQREYVRTAQFSRPVEQVFQVVTDVARQPSWRSDVKAINVIDEHTWTEVPAKGTPITFRIRQKIPNQLFEIDMIAPESFKGYWVGNFTAVNGGTRVAFKEVVVIANPFARVMSLVFVDLDKTMDLYMADLKTKLGE